MQRLTAFDAGFLYMETPTLHMHTLKISILDPSTIPGGYRFGLVLSPTGRAEFTKAANVIGACP